MARKFTQDDAPGAVAAASAAAEDSSKKNGSSVYWFYWFSPVNWISAVISYAVSLSVYIYTLQPTVGLEDSGELITAAYRLGVPHPPGYPFWTIMSKIFSSLPIGHDIAYRVNLWSAFTGALAAGMITLIITKAGELFFDDENDELHKMHIIPSLERFGLTVPRFVNSLCGIAAGVLFALTPGTWSQCTITEVYSLNAFFMVLLMLLSFILMFNPEKRGILYAMAFIFGFANTNHYTVFVMIGGMAWAAYCARRSNAEYLTLCLNAVFLLLFSWFVFNKLSYQGTLVRLTPFSFDDILGQGNFFLMFIVPFVAYWIISDAVNKKFFDYGEWGKLLGSFFLGLCMYFWLPIASATNPQLNWGRPRTTQGLWHAICRGQYEQLSFSRGLKTFLLQCWFYLKDTWDQYPMTLIFAFLCLVTILVVAKKEKLRNWLVFLLITLLCCGIGMCYLMNPKLDVTSQYINRVFFIMSHAALAVLVGTGMITITAVLLPMAKNVGDKWRTLALGVGTAFLVYGLFFIAAVPLEAAHPGTFNNFLISAALHNLGGASVAVGVCYGAIFAFIGLFILLSVKVPGKMGLCAIFIALLCFLTPFITATENWGENNQRYKNFGYIYGEEIMKICKPNTIYYGGTDPGRFVPMYMINVDRFREDCWLITQNGLADDSYMTVLRDRYCEPQVVWGWVRALLKLLNASREDHKKGVDTIYIPSDYDFQHSFELYYQDVEKRVKRGEYVGEEVSLDGGKISIRGIEGVMRLNAILTRMIYDRNIKKNPFFLEESYTIEWMYPYLKPAGIIMELCGQKVKITPEIVEADTKYWKNLKDVFKNGGTLYFEDINNGRKGKVEVKAGEFFEDLAARKSFAKCRTAIGGLYEYHKMIKEAELAYRDAIWLNDMSAEAYMRLSSLLARNGRETEGLSVIKEYLAKDPMNASMAQYVHYLSVEVQNKQLHEQLKEELKAEGPIDWKHYLDMAARWEKVKDTAFPQVIYAGLLGRNDIDDPEMFDKIGRIFQKKKLYTEMAIAYNQGLMQAELNDQKKAEFNLQMAVAFIMTGRHKEALNYVEAAAKADKAATRKRLLQDPAFEPLRINADSAIANRIKELTEAN